MPNLTQMPRPNGRIGHLIAFRADLQETQHTYSAQPAADATPEEQSQMGIPQGYEDIAEGILAVVLDGLVRVNEELNRMGAL